MAEQELKEAIANRLIAKRRLSENEAAIEANYIFALFKQAGYVQLDQALPLLFHKILGNAENPSADDLIEAKGSIEEKGLIAKMPNEWRQLLPEHLQSTPIIWLIGYDRLLAIKKPLLDPQRLFRLDTPEVDWWVYAGDIPPEAIRIVRQATERLS